MPATVRGVGLFMYHMITSIQCVIRSVKAPPPKSQNQRQRRYLISANGCSGAEPSQAFQSSFAGSMRTASRPLRG